MKIAIYNHKGGVGKSTLSSHLGFYAKDNNIKATIIDADRQQCTISWLSGHNWNGDSEYQLGSINVTVLDVPVDDGFVLYDCNPSFDVMSNMTNRIDKWIIPVDGRFSVEGAMAVMKELKKQNQTGDAYIVVNRSLNNSFGRAERKEITNLGLKVFCFEIPQADVVRKAESFGVPVWDVPYGSRSLTTQNILLFCKWVFNGFNEKQLV